MSTIYVVAFDGSATSEKPDWAILTEPSRNGHALGFRDHFAALFEYQTGGVKRTNFKKSANIESPLVKIRLAVSRNASAAAAVERALRQVLSSTHEIDWIDAAITLLQREGLVPTFSIDNFRASASQTLASRLNDVEQKGTITLDYLALLNSNSEVKEMLGSGAESKKSQERSFMGFRISNPHRSQPPKRRPLSFERQDDPYSGLM